VLAATLFAQTFALPAEARPGDASLAARLGAEIGALASAGAGLANRKAGDPLQATAPPPAATPVQAGEAAPEAGPAPAVEAPEPTPPAPKGRLIFIDPGHGGRDPGAVHTSARGEVVLTEAEVNLSIGLRLADMLRQDGYEVVMSRTTDSFLIPGAHRAVELPARVDLANRSDADLFISIHNNGSTNPSLQGTEVWYSAHRPFSDSNRRLASLVQDALVRNLRQAGYDTIDRGIKEDATLGFFDVLGPHLRRPSQMPGILGESLFVSNPQDAAALLRDDIRQAIARGYFEGIKAYFGDTG
jgi:N-acetylmuramoyl-L-alanine amidase